MKFVFEPESSQKGNINHVYGFHHHPVGVYWWLSVCTLKNYNHCEKHSQATTTQAATMKLLAIGIPVPALFFRRAKVYCAFLGPTSVLRLTLQLSLWLKMISLAKSYKPIPLLKKSFSRHIDRSLVAKLLPLQRRGL